MTISSRVRRWRFAALGAAVAVALAGCASADADGSGAASDDKVVVALSTFANEIFLPWQTAAATAPVVSPVFDGILGLRMEGGVRAPGLAEEVEESEDGLTYTIHLRDGVKYHGDHGEVTSEDIAYVMERAAEPESTGAIAPYYQTRVASVETPDEKTVVVTLKAIDRAFADSFQYTYAVPKSYIEEVGDEVAGREPIGTGPFQFASSTPGAEINYDRNEGYWDEKAGFGALTLRLIPDPSTQLASLQSGEVDVVQVSGDLIGQAEGSGYEIVTTPAAQQQWVYLPGLSGPDAADYNPDYPWVGAPDAASQEKAAKVRRALAMAIDKQGIIDALYGGYGSLDSWGYYVSPNDPVWTDKWAPLAYDVAGAKKLLAEAGYPDGFPIKLVDISQTPDHPSLTQAIGQNWEALGLDVDLQKIDFSKAISDQTSRTFDYAAVYAIPAATTSNSLYGQLTTAAFRFIYTDAAQDARLAEIAAVAGESERQELLTEFVDELVEAQYGVQLVLRDGTFAVSDRIGEWKLQPGNGTPTNYHLLTPAG